MKFAPVSGTFDADTERRIEEFSLSATLGRGFRLFAVEGPPAALAELRLRVEQTLAVQAPSGPTAWKPAKNSLNGVVTWISPPAPEQLDEWLTFLRRQRDRLIGDDVGCVVLASATGLIARVQAAAPDLASMMDKPILLPELQALSPAARPVCWLHISDLHMQARDWRSDVVLDALVRDLPRLLEASKIQPDLVFCTGDIANRGKPEEFEAARPVFEQLLTVLGLEARSLYLVPGNHDVDRAGIGRTGKGLEALCLPKGEAHLDEFNAILDAPADLKGLGQRLAAYCEFTRQLLGAARAVGPDHPWREDEWSEAGVRVGIASLCSVLVSGADGEKGRLLLGERQVRDAAEKLRHCTVRIALLHHPLAWLHEAEEVELPQLLAREFHFVLHGHLHASQTVAQLAPSGTSVTLAAGATYTTEKHWPRQVQAVRFDPATGDVAVHAFAWTSGQGGCWHADHSIAPRASDGVQRLSLPQLQLAPRREAGVAGLVERLTRAAVQLFAGFDFVGINVAANRPRAKLVDIFVPQGFMPYRLAPPEPRKRKRAKGPAAEAEAILRFEAELKAPADVPVLLDDFVKAVIATETPGSHHAVLGGPGLGKSTLCRYLALQAAEQGRVPCLVRLRDYLRDATGGMREFLVRQFNEQSHVQLDANELDAIAAKGQIVLLVDGFDEVGAESERCRIRDEVVALAHRWPLVPVVCTSRIVGYDRAPLPESFRHLQLRPFTKDQVSTFLQRWYTLAVPDDARDRQRRTADLLAALGRTPAAQELATIPLLATLIALIHRYSAQLPGSRTKLLDKVVETLLDTWPAEQRRQFLHIPLDTQRRMLEGMAWQVLGGRGKGSVTVDIDTAELLCTDRWVPAQDPTRADKQRLVRQWLDWMVAGTGLLVEASPGVLQFLHLSIGEYLAAQGWLAVYSGEGMAAVAAGLVDLAQKDRQRQVALYAAATACKRFSGLQATLVTETAKRDKLHAWVWLLDLVQEGTILDDAQVHAVVMGVLESDDDRMRFATHAEASEMFAAIEEHDLPARASVEVAVRHYVEHGKFDPLGASAIAIRGELARRYGEVLVKRPDALETALKLHWYSDWAVPTLGRVSPNAAWAAAARHSAAEYMLQSTATMLQAPSACLPIALARVLAEEALALEAANRPGTLVVSWKGGARDVRPPVPAALLARQPVAWLPSGELGGLGLHIGILRIESDSTTIEYIGDGQDHEIQFEWSAKADPVSTLPPLAPIAGWPPAFWSSVAQQAAVTRKLGWVFGSPDGSPRSIHPWGANLLALSTTNLWPTPDGREPQWQPDDIATWPARYLWLLCRWLAAPTDPERKAETEAHVAACPDEYPGLREELQKWTVVAQGTPAYDAAAKALLAARKKHKTKPG